MAAIPVKRRKLSHQDNTESTHSNGEALSESGSSVSLEQGLNIISRRNTEPKKKRAHDGDGSAIYTGGLYKSGMFKLQIDEMLAEVQPNYQRKLAGVDDALRRLKGLIENIEDREPVSIPEAGKFLQKSFRITAPYPTPKPDKQAAYKLAYTRPSNINVVGSYPLKTMVEGEKPLCVDMVVVMPRTLFQEKDHLNYRYFYKRAFYLACIAGPLISTLQEEFEFQYDTLNGNSLQPVLTAKPLPKGKETSKLTYMIRIILAAPAALFPEAKLQPSKNSIRPKEHSETKLLPPTPFYNASVVSDCNHESYLKLLHAASKQSESYKNACILGRIWLRQRGFGGSITEGGFGHFEWATLTALLLKGGGLNGHGVLSPGYSSYQMFKAVIQFISLNDLLVQPFLYEASEFVPSKMDSPLLYDGPRGQNLLYKMSQWSYSTLRQEARASLTMLNDSTFDQFESTFILRASQLLQRFDCVVHVPLPSKYPTLSPDHHNRTFSFAQQAYEILRHGLGDRISHIDVKFQSTTPWSTSTAPPDANEANVALCFVFDPSNVDRLVDHGPPAEDKRQAAKFQKFWGDKAELRRFKDGSILESLVWSPGTTYAIFREIVTYLMKQHFDAELSDGLVFVGDGFERLLPGHTAGTKSFETLKLAFNTFEKDIRALEDLPLQLRQLSAAGPRLRYSSVEQPSFNQETPLEFPTDVNIQFEGSGRWPDDIVAIQRTKIAFLLKIGSLLEENVESVTTRLSLENEDLILQNCAFLDVFYGSGASFRLRIHNDREQALVERLIKEKSTNNCTREEAVLALSTFKRLFIQLPLHTQSISTHCTRFRLLSPTIRLTKLWFSRHMLSGHISEEVIELLVAQTFLQPYPWKAPSSTMTGFLRTLLFISRWDWRHVPLIVDFTGTMTNTEVSTINTRVEAWRKIDPAMNRTVLFVASNHDTTGTAFTNRSPSKMVAARMTALARSACKLVRDKGVELDPRSLFAASTADYDFVIHISSKYREDKGVKNAQEQKFKNLEIQKGANLEIVGYRPVYLLIAELNRLYASTVVFFHSEVKTSVIAGLWNPQVGAARPFKVNLGYAAAPSEGMEEGNVSVDKPAILSEIARIGGDIVSKIEVH